VTKGLRASAERQTTFMCMELCVVICMYILAADTKEFEKVFVQLDGKYREAEAIVLRALLSIRTELHTLALCYAKKAERPRTKLPKNGSPSCLREYCEVIKRSLERRVHLLKSDEIRAASRALTCHNVLDIGVRENVAQLNRMNVCRYVSRY
jgi:hypothetical protein